MKILSICFIVFKGYPYTGATEVFNYAKALSSMGHIVRVITSNLLSEKQFERIDNVSVYRIPVKKNENQINKISFLFKAGILLRKWKEIDIIQIHQAGGCFTKIALLFSNINKKIKMIYNIRSGTIQNNKVLRKIGNFFITLEILFYDAAIFIDEMVKKIFPEFHIRNKSFIISLSINIKDYQLNSNNKVKRKDYGLKPNNLILIYTGNISKTRRIEDIIIAFFKASKIIKDLQLIILGEDENLVNLKLLTEKLGLKDKIIFLGNRNYSEIPLFLSLADVGLAYIPIIPIYNPQPPQKTIEYLAASLPVIATKTKGNMRFIKDELNGLLVKDNPDDLALAMIRLKNDKKLMLSLARKTKKNIGQYDLKIIVKKLEQVYCRILQ
jgi:glycosyltransferase involved in cell wall biosynthesis